MPVSGMAKSYYEIEVRKVEGNLVNLFREYAKPTFFDTEEKREIVAKRVMAGKAPEVLDVMVQAMNIYANFLQQDYQNDYYNNEYLNIDKEEDYLDEFFEYGRNLKARLHAFGCPLEVLNLIDSGEIGPKKSQSVDDYVINAVNNAPEIEDENNEVERILDEDNKILKEHNEDSHRVSKWVQLLQKNLKESKDEKKELNVEPPKPTSEGKEENMQSTSDGKEEHTQSTSEGLVNPIKLMTKENKHNVMLEDIMLSEYLKKVGQIRKNPVYKEEKNKNKDNEEFVDDFDVANAIVNTAIYDSRYFTQEEKKLVDCILSKYGLDVASHKEVIEERIKMQERMKEEAESIEEEISSEEDDVELVNEESSSKKDDVELVNEKISSKEDDVESVKKESSSKEDDVESVKEEIIAPKRGATNLVAIDEDYDLTPIDQAMINAKTSVLMDRTKNAMRSIFVPGYETNRAEQKAIHAVEYAKNNGIDLDKVARENLYNYFKMQSRMERGFDERNVSKKDEDFVRSFEVGINAIGIDLNGFSEEQKNKYSYLKRENGIPKIGKKEYKEILENYSQIARIHAERLIPRWYHYFTSPFYHSQYDAETEYLKTLEKDLVKRGILKSDLEDSLRYGVGKLWQDRNEKDMAVVEKLNKENELQGNEEINNIQLSRFRIKVDSNDLQNEGKRNDINNESSEDLEEIVADTKRRSVEYEENEEREFNDNQEYEVNDDELNIMNEKELSESKGF